MSMFSRKPVAAPPTTGGSGGLALSAAAGGISTAQMQGTMNAMHSQAMRQQLDNALISNNPQMVVKPYPDPPSPQIYFTVRPIKNGFILSLDGDEIFCADIGAVGTRVTTLLAERELKK